MALADVNAAIELVRSQMRRLRNDIIQFAKVGLDATALTESLAIFQSKLDDLKDERDLLLGDTRRKYLRIRKKPAS
jgi:hypothetical protein